MAKPTVRILSVAACGVGFLAAALLAQTRETDSSRIAAPPRIAGVWRGHSVCAVANSPCRDEVNIYRIYEVAGQPGRFSVTGSKIVEGKEIVMGNSEWTYDTESHSLVNDAPAGSFKLTVEGDAMRGTLRLNDNTVYRRIDLHREN